MFGWLRRKQAVPELPTIIVPRSAVESDEDYELPLAVVEFVNNAMQTALFRRDEIPPAALQAFHVDYYLAQVNNGGHSQFVHNSGWRDYAINDIRAGLEANGCLEAQELFGDLCEFADRDPGGFIEGMKAGGFGDYPEFFRRLDDEFFAGLNDRLMRANRDWIASLECLEVLEDRAFIEARNTLAKRNPLHSQRLAEGKRLAEEQRQRELERERNDPVLHACQFVCQNSSKPVRIVSLAMSQPVQDEAGTRGRLISARMEIGLLAEVYLFPDVAMLRDPFSREMLEAVPMHRVQEWVHKQTGQYLPDEIWQ